MKNADKNKGRKNENLESGDVEWYREEIGGMVKQMENLDYLEFIHNMMIAFKKKWGI